MAGVAWLRFSHNLERSLKRAYGVASQQGRKDATPEDLLIALTDDAEAAAVLQGSRIDAERLRRELIGYMEGETDEAARGASEAPKPSRELQRVVQLAATHAVSVGRETLTSADVLVWLLSEPAGHFLQQQCMTRYDATRFISHGIVGTDADPTGADLPAGSSVEVRMLNDDYTPMEFVVQILERVFDMDYETACRVMLHIHNHGVSSCGTFPADIARAKAAEVLASAREHHHPLRCVLLHRTP